MDMSEGPGLTSLPSYPSSPNCVTAQPPPPPPPTEDHPSHVAQTSPPVPPRQRPSTIQPYHNSYFAPTCYLHPSTLIHPSIYILAYFTFQPHPNLHLQPHPPPNSRKHRWHRHSRPPNSSRNCATSASRIVRRALRFRCVLPPSPLLCRVVLSDRRFEWGAAHGPLEGLMGCWGVDC